MFNVFRHLNTPQRLVLVTAVLLVPSLILLWSPLSTAVAHIDARLVFAALSCLATTSLATCTAWSNDPPQHSMDGDNHVSRKTAEESGTFPPTARPFEAARQVAERTPPPQQECTDTLIRLNRQLEQEIVERRATEQALRDSEARTRAIVEAAADGIIVVNQQGIVESINRAALDIFKYDLVEVVGKNISMLVPSPHAELHDGYIAKFIRTGQSQVVGCRREVNGRRKDGTLVPVYLGVSEIALTHGRVFVAMMHDLSNRRELERKILQSQKMESIGQLAAGIAHEINTPMQFIGDNIEYLSDCSKWLFKVVETYEQNLNPAGPERSWQDRCQEVNAVIQSSDFGHIRQQVPAAIGESKEGIQRVIHIVRAMKEFSHPGGVEMQSTDLNEAIRSTATISRNRWKYVADLELVLDPDLPKVDCLPAEINQMLLNLIVNAADAIAAQTSDNSNDKGRITVRSQAEHGRVVIEVEDTGCGIPDAIRNRIFDPFFTTKDVGKGTGQGLAICYNVVVNMHHGTLDVRSTPGAGTCFKVTIPIAQRTALDENDEQPDSTEATLTSALID